VSVSSTISNTASQKALIATLLVTVLVVGTVFYLYHVLQQKEQQRLQHEFQADITEVKTKIAERMNSYGQILKGGRSLFHSSQEVTRQEWHDYAASLELDKLYPGIQGVGYATTIPYSKLSTHEQEINGQGFENYHVWPTGKRDTYSSIIYLHPFDWRNQRAFGYDMYSEPVRREAMERARDTGLPTLTGKVLLVQEINEAAQAGSLLYVAVYQKGVPLDTVEQRRQALTGWVYSPYRMDNLIEGMLGKRSDDFHLHIFDQSDVSAENLIYDNTKSGESEPHSILVHHSLRLEVGGRVWLLNFDGLPAYAQTIGIGLILQEMTAVSLIGLLLILLTWNLFNTQRRAELLASDLTSSLRESETKLRAIIEASPIPIAFNDEQHNIALLNWKFTEMFGYTLSDIPTLEVWWPLAYPDPDYRQYVMQTWQTAVEASLQHNSAFEPLEFKVTCKDGTIKDIQFSMAPVASSSLVLFHDLTEHKQAEQALKSSEQRFRALFEQAGIGVSQINSNTGEFIRVNQKFCDIARYSRTEMEQLNFQSITHPDDLAAELDNMELLKAGKIREFTMEKRYFRKDSSIAWINLTVSAMWAPGESPDYHVAVAEDITAHKQAEEALEKSQEQLYQAQKMEALGTLVGGIAHDFNNMLGGITGNVYLAKKAAREIPDVVHKLNDVEELSFRAADMIKQLLTFARKGDVSMKPLLLNPFIKEIMKFLNTSVPANIECHQNISDEPMQVNGNATQLHQVLMNLINNARDALEGENKPSISVKLETFHTDNGFNKKHTYFKPGAYALLSVEDNGCGIPEQQIKQIFEPFFTTKEEGKGTGLGLAMVFGAIKSHKGYIEVESRIGKGTIFHLYLPLEESKNLTPSSLSNEDIIEGKGEKILIVDDNDPVRKSNREILESLNYEVIEATDGLEAIDLFTRNKDEVSLIITDIVMPRLGGVDAIKQIREMCADIKVIFSTGYDKGEALKGAPLGEHVVLSKPHNIVTLSRSIRAQLAS